MTVITDQLVEIKPRRVELHDIDGFVILLGFAVQKVIRLVNALQNFVRWLRVEKHETTVFTLTQGMPIDLE